MLKPRERRTRIGGHQPSAKLARRQFAVQNGPVEAVEIGAAGETSGQEILDSLVQEPPAVGKKERQQRKREALMDKLRSTVSPYSKVQRRRFNKKKHEQVGNGMADMEAAIASLEEKITCQGRTQKFGDGQPSSQPQQESRRIGEGKGNSLTMNQRKRALELERLRHPLILSDPRFSGNPFQIIRVHAQNTLEKHAPSL